MAQNNPQRVTRLAPSPTGALHLGNARTFLINWAMARQNGWQVVLRIEDLDSPRVKANADQQAVDDLRWLGMDWDVQYPHQTSNLVPYKDALDKLAKNGRTYFCTCTRSEIVSAQSAPHGDEHELRYPGSCRDLNRPDGAVRVCVPDKDVSFTDELLGPKCMNVQQQVGDFVICTKQHLPSYQLAVVVDDARQGVTDVVRGDDLLRSAARQKVLYQMLDIAPLLPRYWHLPLVVGEDGRRLAKRHGDTRVAMYREAGVRAQRVIGLLAYWSGLQATREEMAASEFAAALSINTLPRGQTVFTQEDHQWLMNGA